jgi:hypothetical protein
MAATYDRWIRRSLGDTTDNNARGTGEGRVLAVFKPRRLQSILSTTWTWIGCSILTFRWVTVTVDSLEPSTLEARAGERTTRRRSSAMHASCPRFRSTCRTIRSGHEVFPGLRKLRLGYLLGRSEEDLEASRPVNLL